MLFYFNYPHSSGGEVDGVRGAKEAGFNKCIQLSIAERTVTESFNFWAQPLQISSLKEIKTEFERALSTQPLQISFFRK